MRTICFCNSTLAWGGGEKWHLEAAQSLAKRGFRVLLLCNPQGELRKRATALPGITVVPFAVGRLSFLNPLTHRRLAGLFRREGVDALIMNLPADLKAAGPAARAAGVRHIIYRRGSALPVRNSALNRLLYGRVITRLIVNSAATRRMALVNNPALIPENRITLLPNGIDVEAFDAALERAAHVDYNENTPGITPPGNENSARPFIIGNAGRLNLQKGQHLLLHLCRRLLNAGLDCRVVIAGTGDREGELRALAERLNLGKHVVFRGFMTDLAPFWHSIDLFMLTSLWEGFGNVLIEAMLAEKPVFAFAVSNIPELVTDGLNGRLFSLPEEERARCPDALPPDREEIAEHQREQITRQTETGVPPRGCLPPYTALDAVTTAILALAAAPEEGVRMGREGRRFAEKFSQTVCMDALERILKD